MRSLLLWYELFAKAKCADGVPTAAHLRADVLLLPLEHMQAYGSLIDEAILWNLLKAHLRPQIGLVIVLWSWLEPVLIQRLSFQSRYGGSPGSHRLWIGRVTGRRIRGITSPDVALTEQMKRVRRKFIVALVTVHLRLHVPRRRVSGQAGGLTGQTEQIHLHGQRVDFCRVTGRGRTPPVGPVSSAAGPVALVGFGAAASSLARAGALKRGIGGIRAVLVFADAARPRAEDLTLLG